MASKHLTRLLRALAKQPDLFMEVKLAMVDALVAREWIPFNDSDYAKRRKVGFPSGTMARFTPDRQGDEIEVVKVYKRIKQGEPNWTDYVYDWDSDPENPDYDRDQFKKEHAEWEAECQSMVAMPWQWVISPEANRMLKRKGEPFKGYATTPEQAMAEADRYLERVGWVLVDSKTGA